MKTKPKPPVKLPKARVMYADEQTYSIPLKDHTVAFSELPLRYYRTLPCAVLPCRTRQEALVRELYRLKSNTLRYPCETALRQLAEELETEYAALRARCERLEGALQESCVLSYISKHAADCRQENQRAGYEVYGQATFEAIQADYDRIVAALAQPEDGK